MSSQLNALIFCVPVFLFFLAGYVVFNKISVPRLTFLVITSVLSAISVVWYAVVTQQAAFIVLLAAIIIIAALQTRKVLDVSEES